MSKKTQIKSGLNNGIPEILLYGYMSDDMAAAFANEIKELSNDHPVVNVRVNCKGGDVYAGIAMFNTVLSAKCAIDFYVEGVAMSMMSAVVLSGRKIYMSKYARIMTHKPSGFAGGNADKLREVADEIDNCEQTIADMMATRLGITVADVKAKYLNGKDNFFTAQPALKLGLIDGIYDAPEVAVDENADIEAVYNAYQTRFEAMYQETDDTSTKIQNVNKMQTKTISLSIWGRVCASLGITDSVDDAGFEAAFKQVKDRADQYDTVSASLKKKTADYDALEKKNAKERMTAMLEAASQARKITNEVRAQLEADYEGRPNELEKLLGTMQAYQPITDSLITGDVPKKYEGKTWKDILDAGEMGTVRASHPAFYKKLYKEEHGMEP